MDIQTRKIRFVQEFLKLENENAISHFEQLLEKEAKTDSALKAMTISEFKKRIDAATEDSDNGRLTESCKLISEIEKWD